MTFKKDYGKYLVVKMDDVRKYLLQDEQRQLSFLSETVRIGRDLYRKSPNTYIVVNEDEPYSSIVWKLIEASQTLTRDALECLLTNITVELLSDIYKEVDP